MKTSALLFCLLSGSAALQPARAQSGGATPGGEHVDGVHTIGGEMDESDKGGDVRVDVVVDLTDAGKKVEPPSPGHPAYYLPVPVGYKEFGYSPHFQRKPPSADEVEHMIGVALNQQNYLLMSHQHHPSIVLNFWWGYMAPAERDHLQFNGVQPSTTGAAAITTSTSPIGSAEAAVGNASDAQMRELVAGESYGFETNSMDPRKAETLTMLREPRYYIMVAAYDFDSWLRNFKETRAGGPVTDQPVLLWKAHISTELWGHYFDQVAQTLITAGAPWFGRQTAGPQLHTLPAMPIGHVTVGAPEVKHFGPAP